MADNVAITAGSGTTIAADDVGGVLHQRVKTTWGPDGTANDTDIATGKPLPVQVRSATGLIPIGEPTDAKNTATDTTSVSGISIWKQISASIQAAASSVAGTLAINIGQVGGANILTGAGTAASAIRIAFPTDQTLTAIMTGTVAISGTPAVTVSSGAVAATQSGTYTVQPGNTPNTSAWLVDINGGAANAVRGSVTSTATTAATIIATPGTALALFVHSMQIGNTSTTQAVITLNDSASTPLIVPANGGNNVKFDPPLSLAANTALTFTTAPAVTSILASAQCHKG